MDKRNLALGRANFVLLGIGFAIIVIGFVLMGGGASTETAFNPDIFCARRIKVAPVVCFVGFIFMIYAVIRKPGHTVDTEVEVGMDGDAEEKKKNKAIQN